MMSLGWKTFFLGLFATFFRPFLWVFLDVGLTTRSTLSDCSSCVKGSVVVVGASVEVVSTVRRDMLLANAVRYNVRLVFYLRADLLRAILLVARRIRTVSGIPFSRGRFFFPAKAFLMP